MPRGKYVRGNSDVTKETPASLIEASNKRLTQVKTIWGQHLTRVDESLKSIRVELGKLLCQERDMWKSKGGRGLKGGFKHWLKEAGIPRATAYEMMDAGKGKKPIRRHQTSLRGRQKPIPVAGRVLAFPDGARMSGDEVAKMLEAAKPPSLSGSQQKQIAAMTALFPKGLMPTSVTPSGPYFMVTFKLSKDMITTLGEICTNWNAAAGPGMGADAA